MCRAYKSFVSNTVIVAGSTWEDDEAEWTHFVKTHPEIKFIFAPHEIDKENLNDVKKEFPGSMFYSEWMESRKSGSRYRYQVSGTGENRRSIASSSTISECFQGFTNMLP